MKILYLEQGSAEWHEFRKNHIGGSDAPIVMGVSPYKTRHELYLEKIGDEPAKNFMTSAMQRGHDLEPIARQMFNEEHFYCCVPCVFESEDYSFLSYSSDGYDPDNKVLIEIKCGTKAEHEAVKRGEVPNKYYPQLQNALLVTGLDEIYYVSFNNHEIAYKKVKRDNFYIEKMLSELSDFWRCIEQNKEPAIDEFHKKHTKVQYEKRKDEVFQMYGAHWRDLQERKKELELEEKDLRNEIISMTEGANVEGGGIRVLQYEKKGTVAYKMIPELNGIDLDQYRSPNSICWRIDVADIEAKA